MPEPCSFRQVDEKHVAGDVAHMAWSPKMDLLAIATTHGEVRTSEFKLLKLGISLQYYPSLNEV